MSDKQTEALKLALEALEEIESYYGYDRSVGAMASSMYEASNLAKITSTRIREALAHAPEVREQPAPVAEPHKQQNLPDFIAGAFGVSRGTAYDMMREALAEQPAQQEPVAWMPIEQMYPQAKAIDILMGDGSILCAVLPQFDGDLWWEGSGTGEKFIDPKYANVTHWRLHDERTSPPAQQQDYWQEEARRYSQNADFWRSKYESATAQQQQEPVAIVSGYYGGQCVILPTNHARIFNSNTTLYTSPPASKPWVGLSNDEIYDMYNEPRSDAEMVEFARAIEAKLREKNNG